MAPEVIGEMMGNRTETFVVSKLYEESDAVLSDCGKYRYLLRRTWDHTKPRLLYVMLNPSTADASIDDPTIRSCVRLARCHGYGSFEVVNLFAWRATDPDELVGENDPVGPDNDRIISAAVARCDMIVCAWGAHRSADRRARIVWEIVTAVRQSAFCFGVTKSGSPKHPLYIKTGTPLQSFQVRP
jgi:Uncharacterized protein conserved in bacteria